MSGQQSVTRRNETRPARIDKTALLNDSYRLVAALGDQLHPRAGYRVEQSYELAILRQHLGLCCPWASGLTQAAMHGLPAVQPLRAVDGCLSLQTTAELDTTLSQADFGTGSSFLPSRQWPLSANISSPTSSVRQPKVDTWKTQLALSAHLSSFAVMT